MLIPFLQTSFKKNDAKKVFNQVNSGFVGPGDVVRDFSVKLAKNIQRSNCQLTTSGTISLSIAALASNLKKGDEILVPAYGVISTIHAFSSIGLSPRLVDIDINTASLSLKEILKSITDKTRAICYVNFAGNTGKDLVEIENFCIENKILLIEDAACAMGNSFDGRMAGSFGNISTFSFSVPKVITTGQGGAILTDDANISKRINEIIDLGDNNWRDKNLNEKIGTNLRYTNLQAALGNSQFKILKKKLKNRQKVFSIFKKRLGRKIFEPQGSQSPLYNIILSEKRSEIKDFLNRNGISANIQYREIYNHPPYKNLKLKDYLGAEFWSNNALFLPFGNGLTVKQSKTICTFLEKYDSQIYEFIN